MLNVLHVEDVPEVRSVIADGLKGRANLVGVGTLLEAKETLKSIRFDIILLDLVLPDADGVDAVKKLAEYGLPIVVLSGLTDENILAAALEVGAEDYITKPGVKYTQLMQRLTFAHGRFMRRNQRVAVASRSPRVKMDPSRFDALKPFLTCALAK